MSYVLGLVGSKRRNGNCDILVRSVLAACREAGMASEIIYLDELQLNVCRGCLACAFKGRCRQQDDMKDLLEKLLQAKGLVVAAPTYLFSPSGIIKTVIDRALMLSPFLEQLDATRPAVTISVAGNQLWNPLGIEFLNQLAFAYGFTVRNYLEAYAPGPGEAILNDSYLEQTKLLAQHLVEPLLPRRQAETNQCPVCFSRSFSFSGEKRVKCSMCLTEGRLNLEGILEFPAENLQDNFWTPEHRQEHLEQWIFKTRERFLNRHQEIKAKMARFSL